jgi:predicted nucleic acid-binding protein
MTMTVLLDTDCAIDFLRGKNEVKNLIDLFQKRAAFLSVLSIYELYAGMKTSEQTATDDFIRACIIEPITEDIAKKAGRLRLSYRQKGLTLSVVDCLIAETARYHGHRVATNNRKHYPETLFWDMFTQDFMNFS